MTKRRLPYPAAPSDSLSMLMTDMIRRGARQYADRPAVFYGDEVLTFAEVDAASDALARLLIGRHGLTPGTHVALLASNGLHSMTLDFGSTKARLVRTPLNARLALAEHVQMISGVGASLLIYSPDLAERAAELAAALPDLTLLDLERDLLDRRHEADPALTLPTPRPEDPLLALYTSGTTGVLKAAVHTQASFGAIARNILLNMIQPRPGDIMLHAASLIHASGTFVIPYWISGGASAVLPGFVPSDYLAAIERYRPTALNLVPTMIGMLLDTPGVERTDFASVRDIIYGASPMPRPIIRKALDLWGPRLMQYYGQTEAPLSLAVLSKEDHVGEGAEARLSACGRPTLDCEIRLVDEAGQIVAPGEPGEIIVRAPFIMAGYHQAPDLNAATFTSDGFIRTRDIGRIDETGLLHLVDRASDMIVTGGYNVYPREVEDVLAAHPAVVEAVVVGLPDDKWGEAVTGFVVLRQAADEADILAFCRRHLAGYKTPKSIRTVEALPKSAVGKLLRRAVREPFWVNREARL
jgi:fatty-acyl-CoA synthase